MGMRKFRTITAEKDEQYLLLKMLELNSSLLSNKYAVKRWPEESGFKLSFFLPCLGLNSPLLAKLQYPIYCANGCDKEASMICGGCGLVRYCDSGKKSHLVCCSRH
jgi:hypothetical protein